MFDIDIEGGISMTNRRLVFCLILAVTATTAFAGDIATFANLGFSENSRTFMFAQYGIDVARSRPYAELFTVDVPANRFVPNGVFRKTYDVELTPGQDGSGALYNILGENAAFVNARAIDHLRTGRLVYVRINDSEPRDRLSFRDFETGSRYELRLNQQSTGTGAAVKARFHIDFTFTAESRTRSFTVGLPNFDRDGVRKYTIHQVIVSPDERSVVFVVEMQMHAAAGHRVRYMVETVTVR